MSHILPAGPESPRIRVLSRIDAASLDKVRSDRTYRRKHIATPITEALLRAGYVVEDWRTVLTATSVIARDGSDGNLVLTATCPRPPVVPDGELNPENAITVEYVGGLDDGFTEPMRMDPVIPPSLAISRTGSVYTRYAYDLRAGTWLYSRVRPDSLEDPDAEVEQDGVWDAD